MMRSFGSFLATVPLLVVLAGCGGQAAAPSGPPAAPVTVAQAVRRDVPVTLRAIGHVEAVATVEVRARIDGQIVKVHVRDGALVAKGAPLFSIDPEPYRIARERADAQLERDTALLEKARGDVVRFAQLIEDGVVTREAYDGAKAQEAALEATIRADRATLAQAELQLSWCAIAAPLAGRLSDVGLREGNLVEANDDDPLVTVLAMQPVRVAFSVPEKHLDDVRARAAAARLAVTVRPRGQSSVGYAGVLTFIDNAVDAATGTIRLKAELPNRDLELWPGQFVEAELVLDEQKDAVLVPSPAIQIGQQGSYVFVVAQDGTAEMRPVVTGLESGDDTVIASGLDGGETVITDGQLRVVPGAKVSVQSRP